MKADHDLDTAVNEGSLAVIRKRYSIPSEYGLHVSRSGQRPYSSDAPGVCISVDALEAGLRFPLHPLIEDRGDYYLTTRVGFRVSGAPSNNKGWKSRYLFVSGPVWGFTLDWSAHPIGNVPPYLSEESVLVGRLKGVLSSSRAIKEMTELWLVEAGLSPTSTDRMDLGDLRGMSKVSGGKTPSARTVVLAQEVGVSLGKEPAEPVEEPETLEDSAEEDASPVFHRPRSMKDLFKTKVYKDDAGYYALHMSDLAHQDPEKEMHSRWEGLNNSTNVWSDPSVAEEF
ncbi:hypothetical protein B296_00026637 [Ensete ventricosum]|uniref:Uncharacterized protein n=1 Tax=Ensete ventricosum TaxID=4639 RepID=A0A426YE64_ENSVE|nr:hypothetical protein B296_00026637 [Ensete ventricosum]